MRYIVNSSGYILDVSFGADIYCDLGNCTQYTGDIPDGYSTLEEWHDEELDRLNAWKIINGNLVFDSNKAIELEAICNEQAENNRHITKKELDTALADIGTGGEIVASNSDELKMLLPVHKIAGEIITTVDSSSYEVKRISMTSASEHKKNIFQAKENTGKSNIGVTYSCNAETQEYTLNGTTTSPGDLLLESGMVLDWEIGTPYTVTIIQTGGKATLGTGTGITYSFSIFSMNNTKYMRSGNLSVAELPGKINYTGNAIEEAGGTGYKFYLQLLRKGTTFENYKFKVQIEKGKKSTAYVPYGVSCIENKITLISSTPNLLPSEAVTQTMNGLTLTVNEDKSISVTGNATSNGEFTIAGTLANNVPLFTLKDNQEYYLSDLPTGYNWNLYSYDDGDRELVYNEAGGVIKLTENKLITHVTISWTCAENIITEGEEILLTEAGEELVTEAEEVASNSNIYPMLNVGNIALEYELHKENRSVINLGENILTSSDNIIIENGECTLGTIDRVINTYNPNSVIYAIEEAGLEVDYYKSDLYEKVTATGTLHLTNTYASTGAINKLVINDITAGSTKYLISGKTETATTDRYAIDLSNINGTVDVVIDKGKVTVLQDGIGIKWLDDIYINTYTDNTYLRIENEPNIELYCEYMLKSTFTDIFCTIVEKNASFKVLEDVIQLEVTRASEAEGELSSRITVEADRITQEVTRAKEKENTLSSQINVTAGSIEQIVTSVGNEDEEVTAASIIQAINEDGSSIKISADKVDVVGKNFPTIQNSTGKSKIDTAYQPGDYNYGISYESKVHEFYGDFYHEGNNFMINPNGKIHLWIFENNIQIGRPNSECIVSLDGTVVINGVEFDGTAKFG